MLPLHPRSFSFQWKSYMSESQEDPPHQHRLTCVLHCKSRRSINWAWGYITATVCPDDGKCCKLVLNKIDPHPALACWAADWLVARRSKNLRHTPSSQQKTSRNDDSAIAVCRQTCISFSSSLLASRWAWPRDRMNDVLFPPALWIVRGKQYVWRPPD